MGKPRFFLSREILILLLAGFLLYANTLYNDYAIDDTLVTRKPNITTQGLKAIPEILTTNYGTDDAGQKYDYRPLVKVSYAIEHQFFGVKAGVSHFFNVLFYLLCVLLVYRFVKLFANDPASKAPFYVALLFTFLPIHAEVAASLKNRDILLCFIFAMCACITLLKAHYTKKWGRYYFLSALFFYLAFLCKFDALPFVAILPAIVFIKFRTHAKFVLLILLAFGLVYILNRLTSRSVSTAAADRAFCYFENPLYFDKHIPARTIALFNCLGFYFVQCIFPFKQVCYYGVETVSISSFSGYGLLGVVIAILIVTGMVVAYKKNNDGFLLGLFMFAASSSMYLNFLRPAVGIVADRFIFFGSLGFCIAIVFLLHKVLLVPKLKPMILATAITLLGVYGFMAVSRNSEWQNSNTLIGADVKKYPESAYLNYLFATSVMDTVVGNKNKLTEPAVQEKAARMRAHLEKSVAISNDYPKSLNFLGSVMLFMQHDQRAAIPVLTRSLIVRKDPEILFYKGICYKELQNFDSSNFFLKQAIALEKTYMPPYEMLMKNYNLEGKHQNSLDLLNNALKSGVENDKIYAGIAETYLGMKDTLSAEFYAQKALSLNPQNQSAINVHNSVSPK